MMLRLERSWRDTCDRLQTSAEKPSRLLRGAEDQLQGEKIRLACTSFKQGHWLSTLQCDEYTVTYFVLPDSCAMVL